MNSTCRMSMVGKLRVLFGLFIGFLAVMGVSVAANEGSVRIASIFAKTGEASVHNQLHIQAIRFAVDELNAKGGILGRRVELLEFDNGSTPIQSRLAAEEAVREGVLAVLGASWSDHSLAMAPVFQHAGIPMLTPSSTHPGVTQVGNYIFRACFLDSVQGKVLAQFAFEQLQARTAAIMQNMTSEYSMGLAEHIGNAFKRRGGTIMTVLDYRRDQNDFTAILRAIKKHNPDALFITGHGESGRIVKQAQDLGMRSIFLGGDGWDNRDFWAMGGREIEEGYCTTHWSKEVDTPKSLQFAEKYQQTYDLHPFSALAYDAAMLLADAIERAGALDRKRIRDALANTRSFEGVTGTISMNETGDPEKPVALMEIKDGRFIFRSLITAFTPSDPLPRKTVHQGE